MYYDPMISKLITWGEDRKSAMKLLDDAFDEYVVQGVAHNIGFGKSIVANESFAAGDYSTAFIPDFYPDGYSGDTLQDSHMHKLALACHQMKNLNTGLYKADREGVHNKVVYCTVLGKGDEPDRDWKVSQDGDHFTVTDMASGASE
jgi:propionyl-CoA carboxylase alpha chain